MWFLCPLLLSISVIALDNGLARTPPMGWMSWAAFECQTDCEKYPHACINEELYEVMADVMVSQGYRDAGYTGIHIDDCWMEMQRDKDGRLLANRTRFPSGITHLANYMHEKNMTLGIYEDYGTKTCAGYPGSMGHIKTDAFTFADWNCDYLKFDGCNSNATDGINGYPQMAKALNTTGKRIVYSCEWPLYLHLAKKPIDYNKVAATCNLWRNFDDVENSWQSIASIIMHYYYHQEELAAVHGPGQWNDPDMIVAGSNKLTRNQAEVQMTVWSIWSAPLILSADLRYVDAIYREMFLNKDAIAIDQDPLGIMGKVEYVTGNGKIMIYVKPVTPVISGFYSYAIAVVNMSTKHRKTAKFALAELGLDFEHGYNFKNLWTGKDMGIKKPDDLMKIHGLYPTSCVFYKATVNKLE